MSQPRPRHPGASHQFPCHSASCSFAVLVTRRQRVWLIGAVAIGCGCRRGPEVARSIKHMSLAIYVTTRDGGGAMGRGLVLTETNVIHRDMTVENTSVRVPQYQAGRWRERPGRLERRVFPRPVRGWSNWKQMLWGTQSKPEGRPFGHPGVPEQRGWRGAQRCRYAN